MNSYKRIGFTYLLGLLLLSCSNSGGPLKKLEGKWSAGGDQGDGHSWFMEYTFNGNSYSMLGYPPISESGTIKIKVINGDSMLIGFNVKKSDPHYDNHDEWLVLKGNEFNLNGTLFHKSSDQGMIK